MIRALCHASRRLARRQDGSYTVPAMLFIPFLYMVFVMSVQVGIHNYRANFLTFAVDTTMRELRLGILPVQVAGGKPTLADLKSRICSRTILVDCANSLTISLEPKPKTSFAAPTGRVPCVDKSRDIKPVLTINTGAASELMLVRVCLKVKNDLPGMGIAFSTDGSGEYAIYAESAYVNEP